MSTRPASHGSRWTRSQLLVAFGLYCQTPFGKMHGRNPQLIQYAALIGRSPDALAMKMVNIASLDPAITSTGRTGLMAVAAADRAMWEEMHSDWQKFALESSAEIAGLTAADATGIRESEGHGDYAGADRVAPARMRIGQAFFRRAVLSAYNQQCCITGLAIPGLLVASHIIPWRDADNNKLNPRNGLCLSALHDKAFDRGILTIDREFAVCVSKKVVADAFYKSAILRYDNQRINLPNRFRPDAEFLEYHRANIFEQGRRV